MIPPNNVWGFRDPPFHVFILTVRTGVTRGEQKVTEVTKRKRDNKGKQKEQRVTRETRGKK